VHVKGKPPGSDVSPENDARSTPGFVGADLEKSVNEAAIVAARKNKKSIAMRDFEEAVERVVSARSARAASSPKKSASSWLTTKPAMPLAFHLLPNSDPCARSRSCRVGWPAA
jgi:cell division protease FtsH